MLEDIEKEYPESVRLPLMGSRWVWELELDHARCMIEVTAIFAKGVDWWVTSRVLHEYMPPIVLESLETLGSSRVQSIEASNELNRFWEAVTPIGGSKSDLSEQVRYRVFKETGN